MVEGMGFGAKSLHFHLLGAIGQADGGFSYTTVAWL